MLQIPDFNSRIEDNVVIIQTPPRMDAKNSELVTEKCFDFINRGKIKFILDMQGTDFINSGGLSEIIAIIERLTEDHGQLGIINPKPFVDKTLDMVGIYKLVFHTDNLQEALIIAKDRLY